MPLSKDSVSFANAACGGIFAALAVVGLVGTDDSDGNLVIWIERDPHHTRVEALRCAIDAEREFAAAYTTMQDGDEPVYQEGFPIDLRELAKVFDVDRVLCLVGLTEGGQLYGGRAYEGIDLVVIDALVRELKVLRDSLGGAIAAGVMVN